MGAPLTKYRIKEINFKKRQFKETFNKGDLWLWHYSKEEQFPQKSIKELIQLESKEYNNIDSYLNEYEITSDIIKQTLDEYQLKTIPKVEDKFEVIKPAETLILSEAFPEKIEQLEFGEITLDIIEMHPDMGRLPNEISSKMEYFIELLNVKRKIPFFKQFGGEDFSHYIIPKIEPIEITGFKYNPTKDYIAAYEIDENRNVKKPIDLKEIETKDWYKGQIYEHFVSSDDNYNKTTYTDLIKDGDTFPEKFSKESSNEYYGHIPEKWEFHLTTYWQVKLIMHPYFCKLIMESEIEQSKWYEGYA